MIGLGSLEIGSSTATAAHAAKKPALGWPVSLHGTLSLAGLKRSGLIFMSMGALLLDKYL
jgi:hypothetical protein